MKYLAATTSVPGSMARNKSVVLAFISYTVRCRIWTTRNVIAKYGIENHEMVLDRVINRDAILHQRSTECSSEDMKSR